ncbi:aminotransferase class V-fold PLP-dependent enzyme [Aliiruegeria lutimaris]|uniref:Selenocysteine lyase/Cysteine desulfurase n=1 Tax=Aliiruegeria lutimaris TaxID=571298 RepID=A0A1G8T4H3_9RHOB|nr:aminotransferase class V-fold PLP-dependent enzyme [Aliiruegeria lutimaris]SDJ36452.1 Selenocysteine lyase/Cysteine desulfurase [Aliiruegeria lutimaris]
MVKVVSTPFQTVADWTKLAPADLDSGAFERELQAISLIREALPDVPILFTVFSPISIANKLSEGRVLQQLANPQNHAPIHRALAILAEDVARLSERALAAGATAGLNRIVGLLDIRERVLQGEKITVLIGPYEHHSNILPWRETGAEVLEIDEGVHGGVDLTYLESKPASLDARDLVVGSFSAASNVTGILTDPDPVCRLLKRYNALFVWDYAGGAPYLKMDMNPAADSAKDAIVFSLHKFPGGPGASGIMIVRDSVVQRQSPTAPGGGTVSFVSPRGESYSSKLEDREEGGTPNVIGDIRATLAILVKDAVGTDHIHARDVALRDRLTAAWKYHPCIGLLGQVPGAAALPFFSFRVVDTEGNRIHHQLFTRMLSDHLGIQARDGCACAGSYAHRLLGLDPETSRELYAQLEAGDELKKPGWIRLNLNYLHSDDEADRIIDEIPKLAARAAALRRLYKADPATARFAVATSAIDRTMA